MTTAILYQLPQDPTDSDPTTGLAPLQERFQLGPESQHREQRTFFDTFDWRLHDAGLRLWLQAAKGRGAGRTGNLLCCRRQDGEEIQLQLARVPDFAARLPEGPLRAVLLPIAGIRCLLPLVTLRRQVRQLPVLDLNEKTVVRMCLEQRRVDFDSRTAPVLGLQVPAALPDLPPRLSVTAVRGYEGEVAPLCLFLETDLGLQRQEYDELTEALETVGCTPGDYSSKYQRELDPTLTGGEAFRAIGQELLTTLQRNEPGLRRDLDVEFLHDFRVAVRRTRTALGQLKSLVPAELLASFRSEFRWLGQVTGPKRDLDVFVEHLDGEYRGEVPERLLPDLRRLRERMCKHLPREQRKLVKALDSARYAELLADWGAFLASSSVAETADDESADAGKPVTVVASVALGRAFRKVFKRIDAIGDASPDEDFHRLRIECKKIRYLMEFFRSLFPAEELARLIKALKQLQDQLGEFQDLSVQQEDLRRYAQQVQRGQCASVARRAKMEASRERRQAEVRSVEESTDELLLIGFLMARLDRRHDGVRAGCFKALERFARPARRRRVQELFAGERSTEGGGA